jgi:hypothetical protein
MPHRGHVELSTETAGHGRDGTRLFRVRCRCGWRSHPVLAENTALTWELHRENPGRGARSDDASISA